MRWTAASSCRRGSAMVRNLERRPAPAHALDLVERRHDLRMGERVGFVPLPDEADPQTAHAALEIGAEAALRYWIRPARPGTAPRRRPGAPPSARHRSSVKATGRDAAARHQVVGRVESDHAANCPPGCGSSRRRRCRATAAQSRRRAPRRSPTTIRRGDSRYSTDGAQTGTAAPWTGRRTRIRAATACPA